MDWQKTAYIGGILVLSFVLLFKWNEFKDHREAIAANNSELSVTLPAEASSPTPFTNEDDTPTVTDAPSDDSELPVVASNDNELPAAANPSTRSENQLITISTDTLDITIDRFGGDIVKAVLPQHKIKQGEGQGFTILDRTASTVYIAESGLIGPNGTYKSSKNRPLFSSAQTSYTLEEGQDTLNVDLTFNQEGINIIKRFTFTRNDYLINITYLIDNQTSSPWKANLYGQIRRDSHQPPSAADFGLGVSPFVGAATTTLEDSYKKYTFDEVSELNYNPNLGKTDEIRIEGGWIAMVQHYFVSAWVPNREERNTFTLKKLKNKDIYLLGFSAPQTVIAPNTKGEITSSFYVGPKDIDRLEEISDSLDLTIDFSFLWWIAKPLFHLLDFIHGFTGNWGWAIIILTIIIKAIFFYPSAMSYRSMARMRKVSPKMAEIKERYGDDRQKMSQEMMKLYKTEKVNPMGGCLPILIQMPVFLALYWVLMESVELRHAPFILWIDDLSVMDPYFILPLLMGGTMFIQQQLNPTPPDPMQAKIMKWMPVGFTFLFLWFPSGLVVYWVTNNTLSIIQQYIITRRIEAAD